jgi:hypothetical protein
MLRLDDLDEGREEIQSVDTAKSAKGCLKALWRCWRQPVQDLFGKEKSIIPGPVHPDVPEGYQPLRPLQTLQSYHSWQNKARTRYMESVSSLLPQRIVVMAEQVSLFLTNDNTIISFFESSSEMNY